MIRDIKNKLALFVIRKRIHKVQVSKPIAFNNVVIAASRCFVILPEVDQLPDKTYEVLDYLADYGKMIRLLIPNGTYSGIDKDFLKDAIYFGKEDKTKLGLPTLQFREILKTVESDLLIDLNKKSDLFAGAASCLINASVKIGFEKENSDLFYNFQVKSSSEISVEPYQNLMNFFQMF